MFIPNQIYQRKAIHNQYGGNRQSGICPSAQNPFIFIFSGSGGKQHGYKDQWENENIFSYTGEGQTGDMQFTKGNLALREHLYTGKRVFLFEYVQSGYVKFVSELEFFDTGFFETHDTSGTNRVGIKFFFKRAGVQLKVKPEQLQFVAEPDVSYTPMEIIMPNSTERKGLVTSRVGQGAYRKSIIHHWEYQCAVTNFDDTRILIASHIVPWKDSTDQQRLDVENGILLSPTYDALFDKHLISFENNGKIILSDEISRDAFNNINVTGQEVLRKITTGNKEYLEQHRVRFAG
jgi:5-methylcytosine-specific restriction protein A